MLRWLLGMVVVAAALGCGGDVTRCGDGRSCVPESERTQTVDIVVTSGVPQPPAKDATVVVGPVVLRVEGLGPARAVVFGPDGSHVPTSDVPLERVSGGGTGRSVVGTEQRFTPAMAGTYRVEHAEVPGLELARIVVR